MRVLRHLLCLALVTAAPWAQAQTGAPKLSFETATVKPWTIADRVIGDLSNYPGGRVQVIGSPTSFILMWAFDVQEWQIAGGPDWLRTMRYNIDARPAADSSLASSDPSNKREPLNEVQRQMLQTLLVERFHLRFHRETRQGQVFVLERSGKPLKLTKAADPDSSDWFGNPGGGMVRNGQGIAGSSLSMDLLARRISRYVRRPVLNRTGLDGKWDLEYATGEDDPNASDAATIATSLGELGIRMRNSTGPVETIVIDAIEPPTPN